MPSSCDICWHQKCFSRSAEVMVLIIQLRSVWRWLVNEKYTDSDLCKVSVQMTANKLQSWHSESWKQREGPRLLKIHRKNSFYPSQLVRLWCWMDTDRVQKVTVVPNSCPCSRNHSCGGRKPQAWDLPRQRGIWNKSKDYGLTPQRLWRNFYNG